MHFPRGNGTDPIWKVLASSDGISSWTPLKPQHSNPDPNPNPLANQLWSIDFLTPPTPLIIPSLNLLCHSKTNGRKAVWGIPYVSVAFFPSLKHNFIAYRSSKVSSRPDCIYEIHHLWYSGFSRVYSNSCCSCSFEPEIIKIRQSSHKSKVSKVGDRSRGRLEGSFSTATTPRCRGGCYSSPWIAPLYPWYVPYIAEW